MVAPNHVHDRHESVLSPFIGRFIIVYFDDILIYSPTCEERLSYLSYLRQDLVTLLHEKLYQTFKSFFLCVTP